MLSLGYLANKNMKKTLLIALLLLVGCGSVDSNAPGPVSGSWHGVIQENSPYITTAYIYAEENKVNGYAIVENTRFGTKWIFDIYGDMYGTERAFGLNLQFSDESYDKWVFSGYVEDYRLCLIFQESQKHCLDPVPGPPGVF